MTNAKGSRNGQKMMGHSKVTEKEESQSIRQRKNLSIIRKSSFWIATVT